MATGASITAANLTAAWIGLEVQVADIDGVVTLTGKIDRYSIRPTAPMRDNMSNPYVPNGLGRFTVKVWIEGHKLEVRGNNEITLLEGGLPGDLPIT